MTGKLILVAPCLALLAACGGSSDGSATNPTASPTVLKTFGDGAGIARIQDGLVMNLMAADINNVTNNPDELIAIDDSGIRFLASNDYGDFYGGTVTVNGVAVDILFYEDFNGGVALGYLEGNGKNAAFAGGSQVSGIPSGSYTYNGTNFVGVRDGSAFEDGTFSMTVNFTSSTAALTGSTPTTTIGGSNISVNTSNGTFTGDTLTLTVSDGFETVTLPAAIHGNFHGAGATGVSGLYYDTYTSIPVLAGGIAGTR